MNQPTTTRPKNLRIQHSCYPGQWLPVLQIDKESPMYPLEVVMPNGGRMWVGANEVLRGKQGEQPTTIKGLWDTYSLNYPEVGSHFITND